MLKWNQRISAHACSFSQFRKAKRHLICCGAVRHDCSVFKKVGIAKVKVADIIEVLNKCLVS